jgi:hypothetical protein
MNAYQTLLNYNGEQFHDFLKRFDEVMGRDLAAKVLDEFATAPDMYLKDRELFKYKVASFVDEYLRNNFTAQEVYASFAIHRAEVILAALGEACRAAKTRN